MMRKSVLIVVLLLLTMVGAAQNTTSQKKEFLQALKAAAPKETLAAFDDWKLFYDDFDYDGKSEIIAVVMTPSSEYDDKTYYLFLVHRINGYVKVESLTDEGLVGFLYSDVELHRFSTKGGAEALLSFSIGWGGPGAINYLYKFSNDNLAEIESPGALKWLADREYTCVTTDLNMMYDKNARMTVGRCYYTYYLYVDDNGDLQEYPGKEMSYSWLAGLTNSDKLLRQVKADGMKITNVILRTNGIVDVNMEKETEEEISYSYIRGRLEGHTVTWIRDEYGEFYHDGIISTSMR